MPSSKQPPALFAFIFIGTYRPFAIADSSARLTAILLPHPNEYGVVADTLDFIPRNHHYVFVAKYPEKLSRHVHGAHSPAFGIDTIIAYRAELSTVAGIYNVLFAKLR